MRRGKVRRQVEKRSELQDTRGPGPENRRTIRKEGVDERGRSEEEKMRGAAAGEAGPSRSRSRVKDEDVSGADTAIKDSAAAAESTHL